MLLQIYNFRRSNCTIIVLALIVLAGISLVSCFNYPDYIWDASGNYKLQDSLKITAILNDTLFNSEEVDDFLANVDKRNIPPWLDSSHVPVAKVIVTNLSKKSLVIPSEEIIDWLDQIPCNQPAVVYKFGMGNEIYSLPRKISGIRTVYYPKVFPKRKLKAG